MLIDPNILRALRPACALVLGLSALFIAGCASTRIQAQWTDPVYANHYLRAEKVLLVCGADDFAIKRMCQDDLSAELTAAGAIPVTARDSDNLIAHSDPVDDKTLAVAREKGVKAILVATMGPYETVENPGPTIGLGFGAFGGSGGWHRGGGVGVGLGIGVPVGKARFDTAYGATLSLTDVETGHVVWTSKVTARASEDVGTQIAKLAKAGVEAAKSAEVL
jgi:hypothetical protein